MAEETEDPREVPWHPRFAKTVVGHAKQLEEFHTGLASGRPHHAWMIAGAKGIGKSTLAYAMARHALAATMDEAQAKRWMQARAHPDLVVLERSLNDSKPRKLRAEIAVDDVRRFNDFFGRTSAGNGWRIGLVDAADDLNDESANALLKLVEEPPARVLILLVCHVPGRVLRTLRSRCRRLTLSPLSPQQTLDVVGQLPLVPEPDHKRLQEAAAISGGSPGLTLELVNSEGAKAFQSFVAAKRLDAPLRNAVGQHFASRALAQQDYEVFMGLLLEWLAAEARYQASANLSLLHGQLAHQRSVVSGYNLDRRVAAMDAVLQIDIALKAA